MKEEKEESQKEFRTKSDYASLEESALNLWKERNIFQKSLEKDSPEGDAVFYDGPPFATGLPHYGHLLGSTAKDAIARYKTMRGFHVERRWGWDCHGLPIENIVEKDLGVSGRHQIEKLGVKKFVEHARSKVLGYTEEWKGTIERLGRWVDFDNGYKTMDNTFIESVWWALSELAKKDLLYEGVRVLAYCPRCETPIANSEIAMDNSYKDITDISVYVKFELLDEPGVYLLAWTTTPWSLPGDTAIAINEKLTYQRVKVAGDILVIARDRVATVLKDKEHEVLGEFSGKELIGKAYKPPFDYYKDAEIPNKENIWRVWHADFVTADTGTGIAHEAPAFGEDDMNLANKHNIPFIRHVNPDGTFAPEVKDFAGVKVKPKEDHQSADILVIKYLAGTGALFAKEKIIHSYPHCYRCDTPLLYYALPSWFVAVQKIKDKVKEESGSINWIPAHLKEGRFPAVLDTAPDWTISRNRYWASPLPFWKSSNGKIIFISSITDLREKTKKSGNEYYLMRHGETEGNIRGLVCTNPDSPFNLTKEGKTQVEDSVRNLDFVPDFILTSSFLRAKETAEIVKEHLVLRDAQVIVDERLGEFGAHSWEGRTWDEFLKEHPKTVENFYKEYDNGDESPADVKKRMASVLYDLEKTYSGKKFLIVSHGGPLWAMTAGSYGLNGEEALQMISENVGFTYFKNGEVKKLDFVPLPHNDNFELDLHRPYIDEIVLEDTEGVEYKRIPEVIDCWFESGSMPFAEEHYPFENESWKKEKFPADFVVEYVAQTRTWFYYMHTISTILFGRAPFKNVVTTGTLLASDGQKMSKSKGNFPDPWILFDKYGVDPLRLYLMTSPLMKGEDANFDEKAVDRIYKSVCQRTLNVLQFYNLYRDSSVEGTEFDPHSLENVLDKWAVALLHKFKTDVQTGMENYDLVEATRPIEKFVDDFSTWYLRRSRERMKDGDKFAKVTMFHVLREFSKIIAPIMPFLSEIVWQELKNEQDEESVHLVSWPEGDNVPEELEENHLLKEMEKARDVVTKILEARQKSSIKVRQPLSRVHFSGEILGKDYEEIILDEVNVKEMFYDASLPEGTINLDTAVTPELKREGNFRELVRGVQDLRKKLGMDARDLVKIIFSTDDKGEALIRENEELFMKLVSAKEVSFTDSENGEIILIVDEPEDFRFKVQIEK